MYFRVYTLSLTDMHTAHTHTPDDRLALDERLRGRRLIQFRGTGTHIVKSPLLTVLALCRGLIVYVLWGVAVLVSHPFKLLLLTLMALCRGFSVHIYIYIYTYIYIPWLYSTTVSRCTGKYMYCGTPAFQNLAQAFGLWEYVLTLLQL